MPENSVRTAGRPNIYCLIIAGFINIFRPQRIVIGGGLSEAGNFYIEKISRQAHRYAIPDCAVNTEIIAARLGNKAGSIGAAGLIFNRR